MFDGVFVRLGEGALREAVALTPALLSSLYAAPRVDAADADLDTILAATAGGAPWRDSLEAAPRETRAAVEDMLGRLMLATRDLSPDSIRLDGLDPASRAHGHLAALAALWAAYPQVMPAELRLLRHILQAPADDALQPMTVIWDPAVSRLSPAERAVVEALAARHGAAAAGDPDLEALVRAPVTPRAPEGALLGEVQRRLIAGVASPRPRDGTLHVLTVRDLLQEAEVAAGVVQGLLDADPTLRAADIALVVPDAAACGAHLGDALALAGLRLSGLPDGPGVRDLGVELATNILLARRPRAPAMAVASLAASPLMPWPIAVGRRMAAAIIAGDPGLSREPGLIAGLDARQARLWSMINAPTPNRRGDLARDLDRLSAGLTTENDWLEAGARARAALARLVAWLRAAPDQDIDWEALALRLPPPTAGAVPGPARYRNAPTLLRVGEAPRRPVRHIIALGFNEGAYPAPPAGNPFFLDSEIAAIAAACGLTLDSQADRLMARLEAFRRQIGQASDSLVILAATRDRQGKAIAPAACLALIARCVLGVTAPEDLAVDLNSAAPADWPAFVARAAGLARPAPAETVSPAPLAMGRDLLAVRRAADGAAKPQSPSRLETLIVSPLAWLLNELDALPAYWEPETLTVALQGSIAHEVFERLFAPGAPTPTDADLDAALPAAYRDAVAKIAPFLRADNLSLERDNLRSQILTAARGWAASLRALGAEVIGAEFWLSGEVEGVPVRGLADCLLRLADGRLVIVDHKKSGSTRRRLRLEAGWDLQVELYRRMLQQPPGADDPTPPAIRAALDAAGRRAAMAYHLMNDGAVLLSGLPGLDVLPPVEIAPDDISGAAMARLGEAVAEVRAGRLRLNRASDEAFTDKTAHMGPYAFDSSPLVRAFMIDDGDGGEDDGRGDDD